MKVQHATMKLRRSAVWWIMATSALVLVPGRVQADTPRPLLVAVEMPSGVCCEAAEVRQAVGDELKAPVMSPSHADANAVPDTLIVSGDRSRIVVSMRAGPDRWVTRTIDAPPDRSTRLRAIAWLAGNLARDQVSTLLGTHGNEDPVPALPPLSTPLVPPALLASSDTAVLAEKAHPVGVAAAPTADGERLTRWRMSAFGGPAFTLIHSTNQSVKDWRPGEFAGLGWQVELQRERRSGGSILGLALQIGPSTHLVGAGGFLGSQWRLNRWLLEAAGGGGIEAGRTMQAEVTVVDSSREGTYSTVQMTMRTAPALYARAGITGGLRLGSVELLARIGGHLTTMGLMHSYLAGTVGVRLELP